MAIISWTQFRSGENITAELLNDKLQDTIISAMGVHTHAVATDLAFTAADVLESGPMPWADFVKISDITGRMMADNVSARDHVLDERIHNTGTTTIETGSSVTSENALGFRVIRASDWEWKGHYWEQHVVVGGTYSDCGYIVYFQPVYPSTYVDFYNDLSSDTANFLTLQGVCPLNHSLLDYNIMATNMTSEGFDVRLYALGVGTRFGVVKYPEKLFIRENWNVEKMMDGRLSSPDKIQAIHDRLYVGSSKDKKIVVFNIRDGSVIDVLSPPPVINFTTGEGERVEVESWNSLLSFAVCPYTDGDVFRYACVGNYGVSGVDDFVTYIHDGSRSSFLRVGATDYTGEALGPYYWASDSGIGAYSRSESSEVYIGKNLDGGCRDYVSLYNVTTDSRYFLNGLRSIPIVEIGRGCEAPQRAVMGLQGETEILMTDPRIDPVASWPATETLSVASTGYRDQAVSSGAVKGCRTCMFDTGYYKDALGTLGLSWQFLNQTKYFDIFSGLDILAVDAATNSIAYKDGLSYYLEPLGLFDWKTWAQSVKGRFNTLAADSIKTIFQFYDEDLSPQDYKFRLRIPLPGKPVAISGFRLPGRWKYNGTNDASAQMGLIFVWVDGVEAGYNLRVYLAARLYDGILNVDPVEVSLTDTAYVWGGLNTHWFEWPGDSPVVTFGGKAYYRPESYPYWHTEGGWTAFGVEACEVTAPVDILVDVTTGIWLDNGTDTITDLGNGIAQVGYGMVSGTDVFSYFYNSTSGDALVTLLNEAYSVGLLGRVVFDAEDFRSVAKDAGLFFDIYGHYVANGSNIVPQSDNRVDYDSASQNWASTYSIVTGWSPSAGAGDTYKTAGNDTVLRGINEVNSDYNITDIFAGISKFPESDEVVVAESLTADGSGGTNELLVDSDAYFITVLKVKVGHIITYSGSDYTVLEVLSDSELVTDSLPSGVWDSKTYDITNPGTDSKYYLQLLLADSDTGVVHSFRSINSLDDNWFDRVDESVEDDLDSHFFQFNIGNLYQGWRNDTSLIEPGMFKGFYAVDGDQATYEGDYPVVTSSLMTPTSSSTEAFLDYYNGADWYKQNFNRWPSDASRYARYNFFAPVLIENGDYVNGLLGASNPISKMNFVCYTRPILHDTKFTPSHSFTFDPRYVHQIAVETVADAASEPYRDSGIEDDAGTGTPCQSHISYVPKLLNNSYILSNINKSSKTMINTTFLVNNQDLSTIDLYLDLSAPSNYVFPVRNQSDITKLGTYVPHKVENFYTMRDVINESNVITQYRKYNSDSDIYDWLTWDNNINVGNFALGAAIPSGLSGGWNWVVFTAEDQDTGVWEFAPKVAGLELSDDEKAGWFTVYDQGAATDYLSKLLTASEIYEAGLSDSEDEADGMVIYRLRLNLGEKFGALIAEQCGPHGLASGTTFPFCPTIFSERFGYDGVYRRIVNGLYEHKYAGSLGYFDSGGTMEDQLHRQTYLLAPKFDTVQLFDTPLSNGGLWLSIMSAPLKCLPKYISKHIITKPVFYRMESSLYDNYVDGLAPYAGDNMSSYYAIKDVFDLLNFHEPALPSLVGRYMADETIGGTVRYSTTYSAGFETSLLINDYRYYQILRAIKLS